MIILPGEPEKGSHFRKFITPRLQHGFKSFNLQLKERSKYFRDFSRCPTSTRSIGKFNIYKNFMVAKSRKRGLKC